MKALTTVTMSDICTTPTKSGVKVGTAVCKTKSNRVKAVGKKLVVCTDIYTQHREVLIYVDPGQAAFC